MPGFTNLNVMTVTMCMWDKPVETLNCISKNTCDHSAVKITDSTFDNHRIENTHAYSQQPVLLQLKESMYAILKSVNVAKCRRSNRDKYILRTNGHIYIFELKIFIL